MAYYQRIRDLREDADKTQQELAEYLGTSSQHYGKYESGKAEIPFERAVMLAKFYNVSLDYLAGLTNKKQSLTSPKSLRPAAQLNDKIASLSPSSKAELRDILKLLIKSIE